jgi:hypothetical protein
MHEPGRRPFLVSWPDLPPQERARALVQRHWRHRLASRGQVTITRRLRLTGERWEVAERVPVTITGLELCLPMFGLHHGRTS